MGWHCTCTPDMLDTIVRMSGIVCSSILCVIANCKADNNQLIIRVQSSEFNDKVRVECCCTLLGAQRDVNTQ